LFVVIAFHGVAEASWTHLEEKTQALTGAPAAQILEQVIGQGVTLVIAAVVVIVGVPFLLASLALAAGYIASFLRPLRRSS
jgi:hypothetical protein